MSLTFNPAVNVEHTTDTNAWTNVTSYEVAPGDILAVRIGAIARKASNGDCAYWEKRALLRRDDTDPLALIGTVLDIISPVKTLGAALWDFRVRTDGDNYLYVDVKGANGSDVGWLIFGDTQVLDYPA